MSITDIPRTRAGREETSADDVRLAARRAAAAQPGWAALPPGERAAVLGRAAEALASVPADLVELLVQESRAVPAKAAWELQGSAGELAAAAQLVTLEVTTRPDSFLGDRTAEVTRGPIGVVGVITPWNMPMLLALRSVAPALALGNAVVLKPDPHTPLSGGAALARVLAEAGLPEGVLEVVPGGVDTATALIDAPEVASVSFTGSTAAGREVAARAGRLLKKVNLELGGNNPFVVLEGADVDAAASAGAWGSFVHSGQLCIAVGRHLVHRSLAVAYTQALAAKAAALVVGPADAPGVQVGPLIDERQGAKVAGVVEDSVSAGAVLAAGGRTEGALVHPTVLTGVAPGMRAFDEEIFGPVAPVTVFDTEDEAVALANGTAYGLAAAVQAPDPATGARVAARLRAGMVHVNDQTVISEPQFPFGGVGDSGNGSRFGGPFAVEAFTSVRLQTTTPAPRRYPF